MLNSLIGASKNLFKRHFTTQMTFLTIGGTGLLSGCASSRMASSPEKARIVYATAVYSKDSVKIADELDYLGAHVVQFKNGQIVLVTGDLPTVSHSTAEIVGSAGTAAGNVFAGIGLALEGKAAEQGQLGTHIVENNTASNGAVIATDGSQVKGPSTTTKTTNVNTGAGTISTGSGSASGSYGNSQGGQGSYITPGTGSTIVTTGATTPAAGTVGTTTAQQVHDAVPQTQNLIRNNVTPITPVRQSLPAATGGNKSNVVPVNVPPNAAPKDTLTIKADVTYIDDYKLYQQRRKAARPATVARRTTNSKPKLEAA